MATEKQLVANIKNAQSSTGPVTVEGKEVVAMNAIKHGIFTKDLIITSGRGQESREEYEGLLANLIQSFSPRNQMESLLVEKIAVDFWRLRRTIKFESGSISHQIDQVVVDYYTDDRRHNSEIDEDIEGLKESIAWYVECLKCLENNEVVFDQPIWTGKTISVDVSRVLYSIARALPNLTEVETNQIYRGDPTFAYLSTLLIRHGYSSNEEIAERLIQLYSEKIEKLKQDVRRLQRMQKNNQEEDQRNIMIGSIPSEDGTEKALKYERSIQKSIFQNVFLLKKLQDES